MALIPRHQAFSNQLLADKIGETYASRAGRGWVMVNAADATAVRTVVEQFPLSSYLRGVEIDELFVFDSASSGFPRISLN